MANEQADQQTNERLTAPQLEELQDLARAVALREAQVGVARAALNLRIAELLGLHKVPADWEIDTDTGELRPRRRS